uniref:WASH1 WAHD domain-containing protein n=1 Tax=Oryza meridionalis TaxID=40149 RepID=A0A0E0D5M8_9ORYZ
MLRVSEDGGRRRRETHAAGYGELGRALLDLQAAADQVFDAVTARTAEEREKLSAISRRISAAKAKIKTLSQSEEPLTIVSPAQHPSSCTNQEDFRPLFHDKCNDSSGGASIATISVNGGFNREYGLEGTLELFQFFSEENCDYTSKEGRLKKNQRSDDVRFKSSQTPAHSDIPGAENRLALRRRETLHFVRNKVKVGGNCVSIFCRTSHVSPLCF